MNSKENKKKKKEKQAKSIDIDKIIKGHERLFKAIGEL